MSTTPGLGATDAGYGPRSSWEGGAPEAHKVTAPHALPRPCQRMRPLERACMKELLTSVVQPSRCRKATANFERCALWSLPCPRRGTATARGSHLGLLHVIGAPGWADSNLHDGDFRGWLRGKQEKLRRHRERVPPSALERRTRHFPSSTHSTHTSLGATLPFRHPKHASLLRHRPDASNRCITTKGPHFQVVLCDVWTLIGYTVPAPRPWTRRTHRHSHWRGHTPRAYLCIGLRDPI